MFDHLKAAIAVSVSVTAVEIQDSPILDLGLGLANIAAGTVQLAKSRVTQRHIQLINFTDFVLIDFFHIGFAFIGFILYYYLSFTSLQMMFTMELAV